MKKNILFSCIVSPLAITPLFMPLATLSSCGQAIPKNFGGLIVNAQANSKVFFLLSGVKDVSQAPDLRYSRDNGRSWKKVKFSTDFEKPIYYNINKGGHILLKGNNPKGFSGVSPAVGLVRKVSILFSKESSVTIDGNVMGLLDDAKGQLKTIPNPNCFLSLFSTNTLGIKYANPITKVNSKLLPATTVSIGCYSNMFANCEKLVNSPALPAKELEDNSYMSMFYNCKALKTVERIDALRLANSCCQSMFQDCISLTEAPTLPASELANNCYRSMFQGCKALTATPTILAEPTETSCYKLMFADCTLLTDIYFSFLDWRSCYKENTEKWFDNCPNDQQCTLHWTNVSQSVISTWITGLGGRNDSTIPDKWLINSGSELDPTYVDVDALMTVTGKKYLTISDKMDISTGKEYTINVDVSDLSLTNPEPTFALYFTNDQSTMAPVSCDIHVIDIYADGKRFAGGKDVSQMQDNEFYFFANESVGKNEIVVNREELTTTSTLAFRFFSPFMAHDLYPCFCVYE